MIRIVQKDDPILRTSAALVTEFNTDKLHEIINQMREALHQEADGVAIAAPQIGISQRIFIVSGAIFQRGKYKGKDRVYINPTLIRVSKKKEWKKGEGCLSVRWLYGTVQRHTSVTIQAYDETGALFEEAAGGLLAHIFQHEIDHLNGILFIDTARDIEEILPDTL